jgi:acyl-CoA thioesterase FadM
MEMHEKLSPVGFGVATLHTRVESWECDFNAHWNARFYARSFQMAAETVLALPGTSDQSASVPLTRFIRFHRELFVGTAVEVRSALIGAGDYRGAVVHLLSSGNRLSATALDLGGATVSGLPEVEGTGLKIAFPRGLSVREAASWEDDRHTSICETGPIRPAHLDHNAELLFEDILRRVAHAIHDHVSALGLDEALLKETGISRMAVESRISRLGWCSVGTPLRVKTRISGIASKSFTVMHLLESHAGQAVAFVEHSLLTVDLKTRRAVEIPHFLRHAIGGPLPQITATSFPKLSSSGK